MLDHAARTVQSFFLKRQTELKALVAADVSPRVYNWQDLCAESGKDPDARKAQNAYYVNFSRFSSCL